MKRTLFLCLFLCTRYLLFVIVDSKNLLELFSELGTTAYEGIFKVKEGETIVSYPTIHYKERERDRETETCMSIANFSQML